MSCEFHLRNASSRREPNVYMNGKRLKCVYLVVALDLPMELLYPIIQGILDTHCCSINLIWKLAGTKWGVSTSTLCTHVSCGSGLVADYAACPVWSRSRRTTHRRSTPQLCAPHFRFYTAVSFHQHNPCLLKPHLNRKLHGNRHGTVSKSIQRDPCTLMTLTAFPRGSFHLNVQYCQT